MADTKITALQPPQPGYPIVPSTDVLPIVIIADPGMAASGSTRKATVNQLLGAGGTATFASATITGDLTVDTSTLKVDSANNRVGIGTTSPISQFANTNTTDTITGTVTDGFAWRSVSNDWAAAIIARPASGNAYALRVHTGGATASDYPLWLSSGASAGNTVLTATGNGVFTFGDGAGGTRMTLNSTGLGVGVTPSAGKFEVQEAGTGSGLGGIYASTASAGGNPGYVFRTNSVNRWSISITGTAGSESIRFYDVNNSETRLLIDTSGNLGVGVTPAGSGGCLQLKSGITFPATQVASSDANTLDDYEEGTFTPTIVGTSTAGTATYSVQTGLYTKVGRVVTIQIYIAWSGGTGTGNLSMAGLPFTAGGTNYGVLSAYPLNIALTAGYYLGASVNLNATTIGISQLPTGGGADAAVPYDAAGSLLLTGTYFV